jgi:hypothetical protein
MLAALSTAYVAWDQFRNNSEPAVMKRHKEFTSPRTLEQHVPTDYRLDDRVLVLEC